MFREILQWWRGTPEPAALSVVPKSDGLKIAARKAARVETPHYPVKIPELAPGVVPKGETPAIAQDENFNALCANVGSYTYGDVVGFPGYPRLSMLATRVEYRAFAESLSKEMTREWITLNSSETAGDQTKDKITELTQKIKDIGLQQIIQRAVEHDAYFGRAQIFIEIDGHDMATPLILSPKTIRKNSFKKVNTVEAIWTTPVTYNALDPTAPDFYRPSKWFMLGKQVHASRLMTVITRPLPDMLKPAFNFGGISLSQLVEPYVNKWLRDSQSVSDLIHNFSITALRTSMDQVLEGSDDGDDLFARADLFNATRSNKGLMLLDMEREELVQVNVPLGGLHELQAQSQEHLCSAGKTPSVILLGVAPSGFGNTSEGEMSTWENWISANQESAWRTPIETILKVLQLSMYGEIDPDISLSFVPLRQMTPKELADIRTANSTTAGNYIDRGVIDADEERERLARDPESGYQGLDLNREVDAPNENEDDENEDDEAA